MKTVLTVAGSDCSGGAGIQADLKTCCAFKVYGMSVITSIVAENTCGVLKSVDVSADMIREQMKAVFEDIFPDAVKIGMISNSDTVESVVWGLEKYKPKNVVADPVMLAKDGYRLMKKETERLYIEKIIPLAFILTPNIPEAEVISGIGINNIDDMKKSAEVIFSMGCRNVLIKGGHSRGDAVDILFDGKNFFEFTAKRVDTKNTHGTGCTLSSSVACGLAGGDDVKAAVENAKRFLTKAIESSLELGKGNGPLNHNVFG